jgi:hypothetical protein
VILYNSAHLMLLLVLFCSQKDKPSSDSAADHENRGASQSSRFFPNCPRTGREAEL